MKMVILNKYVRLSTSKHIKKFYILKLECKISIFDITISNKTDEILEKYFLHNKKVFLDKKQFEKHVNFIKRNFDRKNTFRPNRSKELFKIFDLSFFNVDDDYYLASGFDDYLYLPFKTKSEYLKFKLTV